MKPLFAAVFAVFTFAAAASAMTPETEQYLRSIGSNPQSPDVIAIDEEGPVTTSRNGDPEEYSLDILAAAKKKNGILAFITTRTFIRNLKKNFSGTSIPKSQYDPLYLTGTEKGLVGRKFVESMVASN